MIDNAAQPKGWNIIFRYFCVHSHPADAQKFVEPKAPPGFPPALLEHMRKDVEAFSQMTPEQQQVFMKENGPSPEKFLSFLPEDQRAEAERQFAEFKRFSQLKRASQ